MAAKEDSKKILYIKKTHGQHFPLGDLINEKGHAESRERKSIFDWLPLRGLKQLQFGPVSNKLHLGNKRKSMVVSASGNYIAVLEKKCITFLNKEDNFTEKFGSFDAFPDSVSFSHGVWVDSSNILVVYDSSNTVYFLKPTGDEVKRIAKSELQANGGIIALLAVEDDKTSDSFKVGVITSDCIIQWIAFSDQSITVRPVNIREVQEMQRYHLQGLSCCDFNKQFSVLVLAGPAKMTNRKIEVANLSSVSVWHLDIKSEPVIVSNLNFNGVFAIPKKCSDALFIPKAILSHCVKYVALVDLVGNLHILSIGASSLSICKFFSPAEMAIEKSNDDNTAKQKKIADISWWSEGNLLVATDTGDITLVAVSGSSCLFEDAPHCESPILDIQTCKEGQVFILQSVIHDHHRESSEAVQQAVPDALSTAYIDDMQEEFSSGWRLISLAETSVSAMYSILIDNQNYDSALQFAVKHNLDKDEVFKSKWLHSDYGVDSVQKYLTNIKNQSWVLSQCVDKIGSTVESVHSLLSYGLSLTENSRCQDLDKIDNNCWHFCMIRLRLLQYSDRLESFLGVNMGRFSSQDYATFRCQPLNKIAINLAVNGKIGALNLLIKRHIFSLAPFLLKILSAIPETVPVQSYSHLLPGVSAPTSMPSLRIEDWVEKMEVVNFIQSHEQENKDDFLATTEHMVKLSSGMKWPSAMEIVEWYKERARNIDCYSGQLENSLTLLDIAYSKGLVQLRSFFEDASDLCRVIFSGIEIAEKYIDLNLSNWSQLPDYEKFNIMLNGVNEATVIERLKQMAIPFMHRKFSRQEDQTVGSFSGDRDRPLEDTDSFLVKWLKERAAENNLELCHVVLEEGCQDTDRNQLFRNTVEIVETGLYCVYACTHTDKWGMMASILAKLLQKLSRGHSVVSSDEFSKEDGSRSGFNKMHKMPHPHNSSGTILNMSPICFDIDKSGHGQETNALDRLDGRLKLAVGHVEAGRLLLHYQVPRPIQYILNAYKDEKGVKQLLRLLLSKFGRRQRSDSDWAMMWHDMQCLQEKAFPFLDTEYLLSEFCRGLLKAGKFSLARNYLRGTASTSLSPEKSESLVIQAAHEYFFSASSLDASEIGKAKDCLNLLPNSKQVKAEADIIDAITRKLPSLGVTLLPMQFKQIRDPIEIVKMAINSQTEAYLKPEELIELAGLLGLNSPEDIAMVEAAIAREAGATGDFQLAADLCLVLIRKNHGAIWDLCAALARGPDLEKMDLQSRKELLGFALCHCDEESVGELLHVWKQIDIASHCEKLQVQLSKNPSTWENEILTDSFTKCNPRDELGGLQGGEDKENLIDICKKNLPFVSKRFSNSEGFDWHAFAKGNKKFMAFAAKQLPWLLAINKMTSCSIKRCTDVGFPFEKETACTGTQAASVILYWLAAHDALPVDNFIRDFAKLTMQNLDKPDYGKYGCSHLLNLSDSHIGADIIDEVLRVQKDDKVIQSAIKIGLIYSAAQLFSLNKAAPTERRKFLQSMFRESLTDISGYGKQVLEFGEEMDETEKSFWIGWRSRIEEQQKQVDKARTLDQLLPGVDTSRFFTGDKAYIKSAVFSLVEKAKSEKKSYLNEGLMLVDAYGVNKSETFVQHLSSVLVSDVWTNEDVESEIQKYNRELSENAGLVMQILPSRVFNTIDASNKKRFSLFLRTLAFCYSRMRGVCRSETSSDASDHLRNELLNFLKSLISLGFSFGIIAQICFQENDVTFLSSDGESGCQIPQLHAEGRGDERQEAFSSKNTEILNDIQEAYVSIIDSVIYDASSRNTDTVGFEDDKFNVRSLCNALSSLSNMFGDYEFSNKLKQSVTDMLRVVREAVWSKLTAFAEDMQLPSQVRVFILELLQCVAGKGHVQVFDLQPNAITPWVGWDASLVLDVENKSLRKGKSDVDRFKTTLVALKSTELISAYWPQQEIKGDQLSNVGSAFSVFCELACQATSKEHLVALQSLLEEWDGLFANEDLKYESSTTEEIAKPMADEEWKDIGWDDDGWESFPDQNTEMDDKCDKMISIRSLHSCWLTLFDKSIELSYTDNVLRILDEYASSDLVLLTELEVQETVRLLIKTQPFLALKVSLLFPYNSIWLETLNSVEDKLKSLKISSMSGQQGSIHDPMYFQNKDGAVDSESLVLLLFAGLVPMLASSSEFNSVFTSVCAYVGQLAYSLQESYMSFQNRESQTSMQGVNFHGSFACSNIAFPYFIAELTKGEHYYLAGTIVSHFMHVHPVLNSLHAIPCLLKRYLETQISLRQLDQENASSSAVFPCHLTKTMNRLNERCLSALKMASSKLTFKSLG